MDRHARRLGAYLVLGGLMVVLDTTVTVVTLPRLVVAFDTGLTTVQWATTGYALALVAVMPTAAWAIARLGARRAYLLALSVFTAGSLLTGLAWDIGSLIAFRAVQGLGGGLLNPVGMSIALAAVPAHRRGRMMSLQGLPVLIGPLVGPVLGGTLIDHASWRWIFWINVPIGAVAVLAGRWILPREDARSTARLDVVGLLLLSPGITLAVLALSVAGDRGTVRDAAVLGPLLLGAAMVLAFARRAWRAPHPLLRVRVLRRPAMAAGAGTLALFAAAYFGSALIAPTYVQIIRGDSATLAGAIGMPQAAATGLALQIATRLVDRIEPRLIVGVGIATAFVGTASYAVALDADTPYPLLMALGALSGLGIGATLMPTMTAATRPLSGDDLPSGATLLTIVSQTAVAGGTALVAAVLSWLVAVYAPGLHGVTAAAQLPPAERAAYAPGLAHAASVTLTVAAVLMALAGLVSRRLPRERSRAEQPDVAATAGA